MKNKLESDLDVYFDERKELMELRNSIAYREAVSESFFFALFVFRRRALAFFDAVKNSFK